MESHARLKLVDPQPLRFSPLLVHGLDDMVSSGLDEVSVAKVHPIGWLASVVLNGNDTRNAVSVIHLCDQPAPLDELAYRNHSLGR